jgi:hypothetical protein
MPVKVMLCKYLCEHCPQLCDTEPECYVHERNAHSTMDQESYWFEQMCARIENLSTLEQLAIYERKCVTLLDKVTMIKNDFLTDANSRAMPVFDPFQSGTDNRDEKSFVGDKANEKFIEDYEDPRDRKVSIKTGIAQRPSCRSTTTGFSCTADGCGQTFSFKQNLYRHRRTVHLTVNKYKCEQCDVRFPKLNGLIAHRRRQHLKFEVTRAQHWPEETTDGERR